MQAEPQTVSAGPPAEHVPLKQRIDLLKRVTALTALPENTLESMAALLHEKHFPAGAQVVKEGDIGNEVYFVVSGEAEAHTTSQGKKVSLATMGPGQVFGEIALITPSNRRHATVTATQPLEVLTLSAQDFRGLLTTHPDVRRVFEAAARDMLADKFRQVHVLYRLHFRDPRKERMFLASATFFVTFATTRTITIAIRAGKGPFRNITTGGRHIHHLVWGILLLLGVGYAWLIQIGTGMGDPPRRLNRETSVLYGVGSALTLDEFALWLTLSDVYWMPEGRRSIDAVVLFGSLLSAGVWGGPFFRALFRFLLPKHHARIHL